MNVEKSLKQEKRLKDSNNPGLGFVPRIENPEPAYVCVLVDALMEVRKNRGKVVFYHITESELVFLYDIYTQMRNQLKIEGVKDIRALRAVDNEFIKFDEDIHKEQPLGNQESKANVTNFINKYKKLADDSEPYKTLMLSTNFGLFGSDQHVWADTYNMIYLLKEGKRVTTRPLDAKRLFNYIQQYSGIEGNFEEYKKIMDRYVLTCSDGNACHNGRLVQILIDPAVVEDIALFAVLMGAPVLKDDKNPPIGEIIQLIRTNPEKVNDYLQGTKGGVVAGVRENLLRPNTLKLHDLQARILLWPEYMFNKDLVKIKSYWRFPLSVTDEEKYKNEIKTAVNRDLVAWLQQGGPSREGGLTPETVNLKKFSDIVYQGATGSKPPQPVELSIEDHFVRLIQDQKVDQAVLMFEQNYDTLKHKTFTFLSDLNGTGNRKMDVKELLMYYAPLPVVKIAFEKGFFRGGIDSYELYSTFNNRVDQVTFLTALSGIQNPHLTSQLFLKHFKNLEKSSVIKNYEAIDKINNDESIIELSARLFKLFDNYANDRVLKALAQVPAEHRKAIITETLSYIDLDNLSNDMKLRRALELVHIMVKVYKLQAIEQEKRKLIWSIATDLGKDKGWPAILYLIEGAKSYELEKLKAIDMNLKTPPDNKYAESIKEDLENLALKAIFQPLIIAFKGSITEQNIRENLRKLSYIDKFHFQSIVEESVTYLVDLDEATLNSGPENLQGILKLAFNLQNSIDSQPQRMLIWKLAVQLMKKDQGNLGDLKWIISKLEKFETEILELFIKNNIEFDTALQWPKIKLQWKKDPQGDNKAAHKLSAPFTPEDIIAHANTYPDIYNMEYLQSEGGKLLISLIIEKLNHQLVPEDDFEYFPGAYNRLDPSAGYNKSLIAMYVSLVVRK